MDDLRPKYREMADLGGHFYGLSILAHSAHIAKFIAKVEPKSILDWGAGRGDAYKPPHNLHEQWGVAMPTLYDPAFAEHDVPPPMGQKYDFVICSDVLEHVPEPQLHEFVGNLFDRSNKFIWASVCCRPAKKFFTGTDVNLHVTVRPFGWWALLFKKYAKGHAAKWHLQETF